MVAIASMAAADAGWLPAGWSWLHGITLGAIHGRIGERRGRGRPRRAWKGTMRCG